MAHGLMFHHFHSEDHSPRPGSISGTDLASMIDFLLDRWEILTPTEFATRAESGLLTKKEIVLTFDDALKSQVDVAVPVLSSRGLVGIFSVYSSVLDGRPDPLEIFATFRQEMFASFDEYWESFLELVSDLMPESLAVLGREYPDNHLANFPFYSLSERRFRFLRDDVLGPERYQELMWEHVRQHPLFDVVAASSALWMDKESLVRLARDGHSIGLHSDTHPTRMDLLPQKQQEEEYFTNFRWIKNNLSVTPTTVAHPCGAYSQETLRILSDMGVTLGFRSSLTPGPYGTNLEIPREDHANVYREMMRA